MDRSQFVQLLSFVQCKFVKSFAISTLSSSSNKVSLRAIAIMDSRLWSSAVILNSGCEKVLKHIYF